VADIFVTREALNGNRSRGVATVTVHDQDNNPISGVNVLGVFSGPNSTAANGTTDQNGQVTVNSQGVKNASAVSDWCYEVTDLQASGFTYDILMNVMTIGCEGGTGAKNLSILEGEEQQLSDIQIFPNPTNDYVNIGYTLDKGSDVQVRIVTLLGELVSVLVDESKEPGDHSILWGDHELKSGTYLVEIRTALGSSVKRMVVINE
jgi:hypothetical protein